jgi:DUF917 family protein
MWQVTADDLEDLAIGAGILGTGGGGNPYLGKLESLQQLKRGASITVIDIDELPDDAFATTVGGMGAPVVSVERIYRGDEPLRAMRALERHLGRRFTHVLPGEIGGSNAMRPMVAAAQSGLPVVDADGMGRAFPELQMDTFTIYGVRPTPGALADPRGHEVVFDGIDDAMTLERYARAVTIQMGGAAGYAFPPMTAPELRATAIPGTISLAVRIGAAVRAARAGHADPVAAALDAAGGERLFRGKLIDVERRLVGGFARGVVQIQGTDGHAGQRLQIDFQNENLIARRDDGSVLAVVPDLICIVDADSAEPITTEILRYGLRVEVLGIPAPEALKTQVALAVIGPAAFGYPDVPYVPIPGRFGGDNCVANEALGHPG